MSLIAVKEPSGCLTRWTASESEKVCLIKEPLGSLTMDECMAGCTAMHSALAQEPSGSSTRLAASHHKAANLVKEALGSLTRRKRMAVHTTIVTSWKELVTMAVCTATGFCLIKEPGGSLIRWAASYHEAVNLIKEPPGSLTRRQCTCCKSS